ncbi:hypothetical protein [Pseudanabaena minima]|uniref:hypothetical protein n=1 Tax=Pseudanabaena minima TaxID=890415 RepID=UPI003DA8F7C8
MNAQIPDFLGDKQKKPAIAKKKSGISISALSPQSLYNIHPKPNPAAIGDRFTAQRVEHLQIKIVVRCLEIFAQMLNPYNF